MAEKKESKQVTVNESLRWFSNFILAVVLLGVVGMLVAIVVIMSGSSDGNILQVGSGYALIYLSTSFIGLGMIAKFLSQTAKAIVEGMGGNITTDVPYSAPSNSNPNMSIYGTPLTVEEASLHQKLTSRQYNAWINAGQPPLSGYFESGEGFFDWLEKQQGK